MVSIMGRMVKNFGITYSSPVSGGQRKNVVVDMKVTSTDLNEAFKEKDDKYR